MSRGNMSAYPTETVEPHEDGVMRRVTQHGMTLREHFAAMAMQGLLAAKYYGQSSHVAEEAVKQADALLAALAKPVQP